MYCRLWLRHWSPLHLHLVQVRQLRLRDGVPQGEEVGDGAETRSQHQPGGDGDSAAGILSA